MRTLLVGKNSGVGIYINILLGPVHLDYHNDCLGVSTGDPRGQFIVVGEQAEIFGDEFSYNGTYRVLAADRKCDSWAIILEEFGHGATCGTEEDR